MKKHNFNAGPAVLPQVALENAAKAVIEFDNTGMSILEISHRSKEFEAVNNEANDLFRELMGVPDNYKIIFLGGGASTQFFQIPYNFLKKKAGYVVTGTWANKAYKDAKIFGEAVEVASSKDKNYTYIPKGFAIPKDLDYLYITTNNTIFGTEYQGDNIDSPVPLFADMSSDFLSRPVDVKKYALIYGGAQKNLAPAGIVVVIIRDDMLDKRADRQFPAMVDYKNHIDNNSMYNTPPVFNIFVLRETLRWLKSLGGLKVMQKMNHEKAAILYDAIDKSKMFVGTVNKEDRSVMNICFVMKPEYEALTDEFLNFAKSKGMVGVKGHRSVGGFRASCYNALPKESVQALVDCMKEFEKAHVK